jgi:6-phosphogluconate dehydrogenase
MGGNLARQAVEHGHHVVGYTRGEVGPGEVYDGLVVAESVDRLVDALPAPRIVLVYVPHGPATEQVCAELRGLLAAGDIVADGGNSHWNDSRRRHGEFAADGIHFLDVGTSGGVRGAREGACFMVGGDHEPYTMLRELLRDVAFDDGALLYTGGPGTGHFTKLVHNAIEFGMVQAIAEGVEMLARSEFELDLPQLLDNWGHGSVIRSWLVELMRDELRAIDDMGDLSTYVEDTGEVKWVLDWALQRDIPSPVIAESQQALIAYRDLDSVQAKAVALLRHAYGGHPVHRPSEAPARR